jgi:adenylate cyclase
VGWSTDKALYVDTVADEIDLDALGLLDGLDGDARAERAELVSWLLEQGFTAEMIRGALAPFLLPAGRIVGNDGVYVSARQISAETGTDLELLQRLQRAIGLPRVDDPDAEVQLRADALAALRAKAFIDMGLDEEQVIAVARVLGDGLAHAAEVMRTAALSAVLQPGASELQTAQAYEAIVRMVAPLLGPMIEDVLRVQLRHSLETEAVNAAERAAGVTPGAREIAVAFADLVGFTELGEAVPPEELEQLASRLTDLARDVAAPPVRFIKTIGDAVMFVCPDPVPLVQAVLELVAEADSGGFPHLRVGLASGLAVSRAGDWFGSPVNLASRVTDVARPGAVLVTGPARDAIGDAEGFAWSFAGTRHLKGISGDVKLFRARSGEPEGS